MNSTADGTKLRSSPCERTASHHSKIRSNFTTSRSRPSRCRRSSSSQPPRFWPIVCEPLKLKDPVEIRWAERCDPAQPGELATPQEVRANPGRFPFYIVIDEPLRGWQKDRKIVVRQDQPLAEIFFTIAHELHQRFFEQVKWLDGEYSYEDDPGIWERSANEFAGRMMTDSTGWV